MKLVDPQPGIARFDLTLELTETDGVLSGWFEYSTDLFEAATIGRMATPFRNFLDAVVANPEERISRLSLLSAGERRKLLLDWNETKTPRARRGMFSARFARQIERTPEAMAVRPQTAGSATRSSRGKARASPKASRAKASAPRPWSCCSPGGTRISWPG